MTVEPPYCLVEQQDYMSMHAISFCNRLFCLSTRRSSSLPDPYAFFSISSILYPTSSLKARPARPSFTSLTHSISSLLAQTTRIFFSFQDAKSRHYYLGTPIISDLYLPTYLPTYVPDIRGIDTSTKTTYRPSIEQIVLPNHWATWSRTDVKDIYTPQVPEQSA